MIVVAVQLLSHVQFFVTPWTAACQASPSFTISQSLLKLMTIKSVMLFNHLILCCPLLLLPSIFSSIRVFSNELALCIRWPKYWTFSFSISPSNEYSGLISFRIDWFDFLAVQGTLKRVFFQHNSKASILQHSAFFYSPTLTSIHDYWKNPVLTIRTFVGKVRSRLFNVLSGFVIAFLPRSKHFLISWLQSLSTVILESKKINLPVSTFSPTICHEVAGPDAMILGFLRLSFKSVFSLSSFTFIKSFFSSSSPSTSRVVSCAYLRLLIFLLATLFQLVIHPAWHFT